MVYVSGNPTAFAALFSARPQPALFTAALEQELEHKPIEEIEKKYYDLKRENQQLKKYLLKLDERVSEQDKKILDTKAQLHRFRKYEKVLDFIEQHLRDEGFLE